MGVENSSNIRGDKEKVIAIIADVDYTLTPEYMQKPLFDYYGHDPQQFWNESRAEHKRLEELLSSESSFQKRLQAPGNQLTAPACYEITYADMILEHVKRGCPIDGKKWDGKDRGKKPLTRELLRELGAKIEFFPGLPEAIREDKEFVEKNPEWSEHNIRLEWHLVSLGISEMIRGSAIGKYVDGVFAYRFAPARGEHPTKGVIDKVATPVTYSSKTQHIYQLNKGPLIDVNEKMAHDIRRIPFEHMLYLGDGQSDVPAFAVMKRNSGKSIAVYSPNEARCYLEAVKLYSHKRVHRIAEADYTWNSPLRQKMREWITLTADCIVKKDYEPLKHFWNGR